jgi:hypothetical protein
MVRNWITPISIAFLAVASCSNSDQEVSEIQAAEHPPMQRVINGTFTYSERGNTLHVLKAGEMTRIEGGSAESPEDLVEVRNGMELFIDGNESNHEAHLQAQWASLDEKNLRLVAEHEVVLSNRKGDILETEYLVWAEDSNRVWTNRPSPSRASRESCTARDWSPMVVLKTTKSSGQKERLFWKEPKNLTE